MSEIPEGQLSRASVVGGAAIRLGVRELQRRAKKQIKSGGSASDNDQQFDEKSAELLFDALTKLKGTAVKLAQMLSMEVDVLPEKFQQELAKSYHQIPSLNRVLVNKVISEEFGVAGKELFGQFNPTAFAAASLGQVHAATLPSKEKVAVKIQYPGIHVAIESDIKLLRKIAFALPNRKVVEQSIDEVHKRLQEELDYSVEASNTRWFRNNLCLQGIEIPLVYDRWCSNRVLTTQLLEGLHLDAWLATNPSQQFRDLAGQRLYDQFAHSTLNLKCLHSDPNPGNYLFRDDGSIGLIDFGCVRSFSNTFVSNLPELLQAFMAGDKEAVFAGYAKLGMTFDSGDETLFDRVLKPFGQWLCLPFQNDSFDFAAHSDYTRTGRDLIHKLASLSSVDTIAEEFIFFDRTVYGLCKIFEKMKATVRMRHHWE